MKIRIIKIIDIGFFGFLLKNLFIEIILILGMALLIYLGYCIDNRPITFSYQILSSCLSFSSLIVIVGFLTEWLSHTLNIVTDHNFNLRFVHRNIINLYTVTIFICVNILAFILLIPKKYLLTILIPFAFSFLQLISHIVRQYFRK